MKTGMKPASARALKAEIFSPASGAAKAFAARVAPKGIALGLAPGKTSRDVYLAAYVTSEEIGERIREKAKGAAQIHVVPSVLAMVADTALLQQRRERLRVGLSIGHVDITAGTLGAFCRKKKPSGRADAGTYILTNAHVGAPPGAVPGDMIVQPGPLDGRWGSGYRPVAVLTEMQQPGPDFLNVIDACVSKIIPGTRFVPQWPTGFPKVVGTANPSLSDLGKHILGSGRTTSREVLRVIGVEIDGITVGHGSFVARFVNQSDAIPVAGFTGSRGGDSGSVYMRQDTGIAKWHLHAGGPDRTGVDHTFFAPLQTTLNHFGMELIAE